MTAEQNELMARLAEARIAYMHMGNAGHAVLAGYCTGVSNRFERMLERMQRPEPTGYVSMDILDDTVDVA